MLCLSPGKGGLELYANRSIKILKSLGHQCITVCSQQSSVFNVGSESTQNVIYTLKISFRLLPLFTAYKLSRIIVKNNIDIIHIHWSRDFNIAVFAKILSPSNVKLIYTRHMAITRHKDDLYHKFLYGQVDRFVVITKQLMKEANEFLPLAKSKIKLLYHAINKPQSSAVNCDKFSINGNSKTVLHVAIFSRIEEGKGQHLLVDAVQALKLKDKEVHVTIIGHVMDGEYYQQLQKNISEYQLENQFHFFEFIEQASSYMSCFDVVALTTYAETFGLVLIEAMQAGVAVIGSNAGGVPEIIHDKVSGLLFNSRDAESLSKKIEYYFDNPETRKEIALQGKNSVEVDFSEEQHKKALNEIVEGL
ncbi:glycosyl transferase, group 1 [hydrothermal vent metagenome]|uniref:Glycosyl transferase, group 1 n=1 Tax=hydrothermal vent metagenome TaxID=652676 RepID=A0A3B1ADE0_9ZZZZ